MNWFRLISRCKNIFHLALVILILSLNWFRLISRYKNIFQLALVFFVFVRELVSSDFTLQEYISSGARHLRHPPYSQTLLTYVPLSKLESKFHNHKEQPYRRSPVESFIRNLRFLRGSSHSDEQHYVEVCRLGSEPEYDSRLHLSADHLNYPWKEVIFSDDVFINYSTGPVQVYRPKQSKRFDPEYVVQRQRSVCLSMSM
ncbi:hypothetical protein ANN_24372 [Periplaneta americana]|uniref:Uncharacterized protein n=1 Tax=Periplaneta americana TaxID=6978 RepID=A0ABQ8S2W4_PERAM|nr:hypothetical protein ANN_24372 [Periplaneta americana]